MTKIWTTYRPHFSIGILAVLYVVGIVGLGTSSRDWFLAATPLTLCMTAALLLLNHSQWNAAAVVAILTATGIGFTVEVLGVATGRVFGDYAYGPTLGMKLWAVPLVIGLNWLVLTYSTTTWMAKLQVSKWLQALLAALAMTVLDVLIEPVAMALDFWDWQGGIVPVQNYVAWFVISFVFAAFFLFLRFDRRNPVAMPVILLQVLFFGILNLTL